MQHRLLRWLPAAVAPVVVAGVVAVPLVAAATPPELPTRSAQQVLELVAKAKDVEGFSGTIKQTSDLGLGSIPTVGAGTDSSTASALELITGDHTAKVSVAGATKERVAVLDPSAERDVIRNGRTVWVWNSKTNSATKVTATGTARPDADPTTTSPAELASRLLAEVRPSTAVTVDTAQSIAGRDAYTLVLRPRTAATTVGSVRIAVDAKTGLPLDVQVIARGASSPAFETGFTDISYAVPAASTFAFTPPADAKVTEKTITAPDRATRDHRALPAKPVVSGSGWATVVTLPAADVPSDLASNPTVRRLTEPVAGGRVLKTALVNVLLTDDGRVLAGAVPVAALESAAG
ncbi:LolA family protein [Amnibacterium kyonggiense]|uniref:Outer membrane lipoprotein-sorting protein n=1 Tax=Amnibacterium kyonggiense TaxID=595671 RepID=A0A4R7FKS8_9MICO|nr:outer-membrane lipoprotein carrier protein LolA [Amnibacterium kyonggiense]TDS76959.1 outer membrane lipoprotein-sorting protein [Amnibacterium kyonggiense]